MDIINYVFQIPQEQNIEDYKKGILGEMLEDYFNKENNFKDNQKIIYQSKIPETGENAHTLFSFLDSIFDNTNFICECEELWDNIQQMFDEIKLKDKNYKNRLMNEDKKIYNKSFILKMIYFCYYFIIFQFAILSYFIMHKFNYSILYYLKDYSIYLSLRLIITIIVTILAIIFYYNSFDVILWIIIAIWDIFVFSIKLIFYLMFFILIGLLYVFKFLLMFFIFAGHMLGLLFKSIGKFFVVLFESSENIEDEEDIKYVANKIREDNKTDDNNQQQNIEGSGYEVLDSVDGFLDSASVTVLGDSALNAVSNKTTRGFKQFIMNVDYELGVVATDVQLQAYDFALSNSVNSCKNKNVLEKMLLQDDFEKNQTKKYQKKKNEVKDQNFIDCITSD